MDEIQEEQKNLFERLKEIRLSKGISLDASIPFTIFKADFSAILSKGTI